MLKIKKLTATMFEEPALQDINITVKPGEIHAILGPEGSGRGTVLKAIMGDHTVEVEDGTISFNGRSIMKKSMEERAQLGIYKIDETQPEIEGLTNLELLLESLKYRKDPRTKSEIEQEFKSLCKKLGLGNGHGNKPVNHCIADEEEIKKNELLYMLFFNPKLVLLDKIDSGISDIVELELIATTIKEFISDGTRAVVVVSDKKKFLDMLQPTNVHIMIEGEIVEQGKQELYQRIEEDGDTQLP